MRRWTNGLPRRNRETGQQNGAFAGLADNSVSEAHGYPSWPGASMLHTRGLILMQLSRSPAQHFALRRTAGPYILSANGSAERPTKPSLLLIAEHSQGTTG